MDTHLITSSDEASPSDVEAVLNGLRAFNQAKAGPAAFRKVHLFARDSSGVVLGGLIGREMWNWLYVEFLWINESLRGRGLGSQLLLQAEKEAKDRGRTHVLLDTLEFQAPRFYARHGYHVFGVLEDFPSGFSRYYLTKSLEASDRREP